MRTLLVLGGDIQFEFAADFFAKEKFDFIIAADRGYDTCHQLGVQPDVWVGDFDSTKNEVAVPSEVKVITLCPEKDDTDSEYAINYALTNGATELVILGALGGRMDHAIANIAILGLALRENVEAVLVDHKNRIRMIDKAFSISKEEQFGTYFSVIPFGSCAKGVSIEGVKYPLSDFDMDGMHSLGVSNEIVENIATVTVQDGILLLIEARD